MPTRSISDSRISCTVFGSDKVARVASPFQLTSKPRWKQLFTAKNKCVFISLNEVKTRSCGVRVPGERLDRKFHQVRRIARFDVENVPSIVNNVIGERKAYMPRLLKMIFSRRSLVEDNSSDEAAFIPLSSDWLYWRFGDGELVTWSEREPDVEIARIIGN